MKRNYDWLYLFALVLALIAFCLRFYRWRQGGSVDVWEMAVPGLFVIALFLMWLGSRARRQRGGDSG